MTTDIGIITGGAGTKKLGANKSIDNADIALVVITEDAPNLKLYRPAQGSETTHVDVTADHFDGTTPKAGDIIKGFKYNFWKVEVGSSGAVICAYA